MITKENIASHVQKRFTDMANAKTRIRKVWFGTNKILDAHIDWIVDGEDFDKPVRFPTLRDVKQSLVDKFMQDPPQIILREGLLGEEDSKNKIIALQSYVDNLLTSIHEKKTRRQVIDDMFTYGSGFRAIIYHQITREYDGEEETLFDNVATYKISPEDMFIDDAANTMHDELRMFGARDVIVRHRFGDTTLKDLYEELVSNEKIDSIPLQDWFANDDDNVSREAPLEEKTLVNVKKLYEYMNHEENIYALVGVNGDKSQTLIFTTLKEAKGTTRIPVAQYSFEVRNDTVWADNLAALLAPYIYLQDTLINLEIMNLKLTLQPVLAMSSDFGFNPKVHQLRPGAVWKAGNKLTGDIKANIQPIIAGNPNTNFYNFHNLLESKMTITTRSDVRSLEMFQDKTATVAVAQNKSMNAHSEHVESINEIEAEGVMVKIILEVMKSFMDNSVKKGKKKLPRKVKIKGYAINQPDGENPRFIEQTGKESFFELTNEIISLDAEVEVVDKRSQKASDMDKLGRLMQAIPLFGNIAQLDPEAIKKLNILGMIEQFAEYLGLDLKRTFKEGIIGMTDDFQEMRQNILLGNKIELKQDESRDEAKARLDYLVKFKYDRLGKEKKSFKEYSKSVKNTWQFYFDKTMESIKKPMRQAEEITPPEIVPQMQSVNIPTPDKALSSPQSSRPQDLI